MKYNANFYKKIGEKIRIARLEAGLTQEDLGKKLNISGAAVGYFESGKRKIGIALLKEISKIVDKPMSFFVNNRAIH